MVLWVVAMMWHLLSSLLQVYLSFCYIFKMGVGHGNQWSTPIHFLSVDFPNVSLRGRVGRTEIFKEFEEYLGDIVYIVLSINANESYIPTAGRQGLCRDHVLSIFKKKCCCFYASESIILGCLLFE